MRTYAQACILWLKYTTFMSDIVDTYRIGAGAQTGLEVALIEMKHQNKFYIIGPALWPVT